jgi:hypothetical protein
MKSGYAFAGTNAYLADKISTVIDVFSELKTDLQAAVKDFEGKMK